MTPTNANDATVGLLLSGGLDSGILLGHLLQSGRRVQPFYVRSHLVWENTELEFVRTLLKALSSERLASLAVLEMPLWDLYGDHWSTNGHDAPDAASLDDAVYLPGRNALLAIKPALWCAMRGIKELMLAVLATNPFADATEEFFQSFETALALSTGNRVRLVRPFAQLQKKDVMQLGQGLPLELTFSCIAPIGGLHCGNCNKCAERQHAFRSIGVNDPTRYVKGEC